MNLLKEFFIKNLNENIEEIKTTVLIGDSIAYFLSINLNDTESIIVNKPEEREFTTKTLISQLQTEEPDLEIKNVIISVGSYDYFSSINQISLLSDIIFDLYPNAEYYVVEGYLEPDLMMEFDDSEIKDLDQQRFTYYKEFYNNGFTIVESGDLFADEPTEAGSPKILDIINELNTLVIMDPDFIEKEGEKKIVQNVTTDKNDDEADFDTIYEFLNRFEKIIKSNNVYSSSLSSKTYDPDVHQIEIALRFLLSGSINVFDADGVFDKQTEDAIKKFQRINNLDETGVADPETLDDLYYELKAHSFDTDDLAEFMKREGVKNFKKKREFTGTVDSVWKGFTDKIIDNFEGGYWNKDITKPNSEKCMNHPYDPIYDNSGETMFGIDRRAGDWDNNSDGREYFGIIDDEKESAGSMDKFCQTWTYGYRGGDLQEDLKLRASSLMKKSYERNKKYLSPEALGEVESNKRLLFHFAYACWNGPGHFQDFAEDINSAVNQGLTGYDLVDVAVDSRNRKFGGGSWGKANKKVVDIIKNDPELEN
jgi:peptidoglycan hydrolase-like protein with peptidoglycan-binding domain